LRDWWKDKKTRHRVAIATAEIIAINDMMATFASLANLAEFWLKDANLNTQMLVATLGGNEISYQFDPKSDFVTVNCKVHGRSAQIKFRTLSGDWFAASLSDDGRHLVLAEPYDFALYALD
jgi:hypothetical protein